MKHVIDYTLLRRRLKAKGYSQCLLSKCLGVSETHFSRKLSGLYQFNQDEIIELCHLLDISRDNIPYYFFIERQEPPQPKKNKAVTWKER